MLKLRLSLFCLILAGCGCAGSIRNARPPDLPPLTEPQQERLLAAMMQADAAQDANGQKLDALAEAVAETRQAAVEAKDIRQPLMAFGGPDLTQPNPATARHNSSAVAGLRVPDAAGKQLLERLSQNSQKVGEVSQQIANAAQMIAELTAQVNALKNQPQSSASSALEDQGPLGVLSAIATLLAFILGRVTKKGVQK